MNKTDPLDKKVIGIIGSGQLGKMTAIAAIKLGHKTHIFASAKNDPACSVADDLTIADFCDKRALESFAQSVDLVTIESENIPCSAIDIVSLHADFYPGKKALHISQNRLREKDFIRDLSIKTADYKSIQNYNQLLESSETFSYPVRLKTTEMGYDGKGQYVIENDSELKQFASFDWNKEYILEASVDLLKEVSIVVARNKNGKVAFFPIAENHHVDGILNTSIAPAKIDNKLAQEVQKTAKKIATALDVVGILAIEFFITQNHELLVNELAPRPHNSCHWSLDACNVSQFEQLVRVICGLPMQEVVLRFPCMTKNIIGNDIYNSHKYLSNEKASLTIYGKKEVRDKRKMGHVNIDLSY
ncbi:5-(carboxyamino)imidazole ribonucleotide synthase [Wolbachia endosymbiont of Nasonia vitripennis]|uniref:5-(carboxyamino)imidazole ribonucleotide synthase n=1 Tax=unclassified Wolbachia TaxID=2640676 RepID=UPI0002374AC5|nr:MULTISPECIES: 5-(carboxyamino)imidazole ribonucleotide synthase [unclassified Wolbachia]OAM06442.1 MAG: phosphoribosylaminoimidazole carboxylase [Wolbachia endosymbiont of Dactylopius coccus]TNK93800.1 5-(carboxyamino)imidazole ribonucleotide synthase [Wolbachia endosymbiont of Leptopilina clavipes]